MSPVMGKRLYPTPKPLPSGPLMMREDSMRATCSHGGEYDLTRFDQELI